jgi:hypothetical protein
MSARGNALLLEEKERNKVNRMLPKLEQELHALIAGTYGTGLPIRIRQFILDRILH